MTTTKIINGRFYTAFNSLKRKIDNIPLTAYDREEILMELVEIKQQFDNAYLEQKQKSP